MSNAQDFGDIHGLIVARLLATITSVKAVEPYAGQIEDAVEGRTAMFPLLAVRFSGEGFEEVDGPTQLETNEFEIGIFSHTMRGRDALNSLSRQLIRDVKQSLVNAKLAENLQAVKPVRLFPVYSNDTTQVYSLMVSVAMDQEYQWPT